MVACPAWPHEHPRTPVRMVLTGFGVVWTETQIRTILGRPRLGITLTAAHARLAHAGVRVALHEDWSLNDLPLEGEGKKTSVQVLTPEGCATGDAVAK
jgi:hypothetical protein